MHTHTHTHTLLYDHVNPHPPPGGVRVGERWDLTIAIVEKLKFWGHLFTAARDEEQLHESTINLKTVSTKLFEVSQRSPFQMNACSYRNW